MKQHLFLLAAILLEAAAYAQVVQQTSVIDPMPAGSTQADHRFPPKMIARFHAGFPGAKQESWMTSGKGATVRFVQDSIEHLVFLNKAGTCTSYIRYYKEKQLPAAVRNLIRSCYFEYTIGRTQEVHHNGITAYLVTIDAPGEWKVIRIVDDDWDVYETHRK